MRQKKFRLFSKVIIFYIFFSLFFFIMSGLILQNETNRLVERLLQDRFTHRERWIEKTLKKDPEKALSFTYSRVNQIDGIPLDTAVSYSDTLIINEQTQLETIARKKTGYVHVNGIWYRYEIPIEIAELYQFKEDIFRIILIVFAFMALALVIGNYILSGVIFIPFRKILKQMSDYKIGRKYDHEEIKTSTREFDELKVLYNSMKQRIEDDYYQLKEYTEDMSHELQTPLTVIQNKIESLISENNLNASQASKIKMIYDETIHLSKLGSTLNLLTKIENKEFNNIRTVYTLPVIKEHIEKVEDLATLKGLKFELTLSDQHQLQIDPGLFEILIRNLIKNALHYSNEGSVIKISTSQHLLAISNHGNPLDFPVETIFNRYKKGNGKGSLGLGLAIVKKICTVNQLDIRYSYEEQTHLFEIFDLI